MVDADTLQIPLVESVYAFVDFDFMMPSERMEFCDVGEFFECAVRF